MENKTKVELDLKIIMHKHKLKKIKYEYPRNYFVKIEYKTIIKELKELLGSQKLIDIDNFKRNLMSIEEFKEIVLLRKKNKLLFAKLSNIEKEFIKENNYNYIEDQLNFLTNIESPNCELTYKWKELQIKKFESNKTNI